MTDHLLTPELADHFAGPSMTIVAARDDRFRAAIGRADSVQCDVAAGHIDIFVSAAQWPDFSGALKPGAIVAVTATHPDTYLSYQAKGPVIALDPADECAVARARLHADRMLTLLDTLGSTRQQLAHIFCVTDLQRIRIRPTDIFAQTPGPGAGGRV